MRRSLKSLFAAAALATAAIVPTAKPAEAGMDPFVGEIMLVGFTFCPRGYAEANGQLLQISSHAALFSLYGAQYGGDGRTTFALPDLRGRVPVHVGQGPGLSNRAQGATGGSETNTLTVGQLPPHGHSLNAISSGGDNPSPSGNLLADDGSDRIYAGGTPNTQMAPSAIGNTGSGQAVNNMQPFVTLRYCVALQGLFPPRS